MTLAELKPGQMAFVQGVQSNGVEQGFKTRLEAMGFVNGKPIRVVRSAWFGGPLQVRVGSTTELAIRRNEANLVFVVVDPSTENI